MQPSTSKPNQGSFFTTLKRKPMIIPMLAIHFGCSRYVVHRILDSMEKRGAVERVGMMWRLTNKARNYNSMVGFRAAERKRRAMLDKRNRMRRTTCTGCRHNYYNYPKEKGANGDVAVDADYHCWTMEECKPSGCPGHSARHRR
jgi:hypothetical protein